MDRRLGRYVPEQVVSPGHGGCYRTYGRTLGEGTQDRGGAGRDGNVGATGNQRLHGRAATGRVERVDPEPMFCKNAIALAEIWNGGLPIRLLRQQYPEGVL